MRFVCLLKKLTHAHSLIFFFFFFFFFLFFQVSLFGLAPQGKLGPDGRPEEEDKNEPLWSRMQKIYGPEFRRFVVCSGQWKEGDSRAKPVAGAAGAGKERAKGGAGAAQGQGVEGAGGTAGSAAGRRPVSPVETLGTTSYYSLSLYLSLRALSFSLSLSVRPN